MPALTSRIVGSLWTIVSALTIVVAILISVIRLMLPHIDQQRASIEIWLGEITSRPVNIGEVSASWRGWAPTIDVTDLVLLSGDRKAEIARFDYAEIEISPFVSLWRQHLIPRSLLVGGMQIALERDINGQISIAGLPPSRWPVAEWLLEQRNFTLRDADITFTDALRDAVPRRFSDVTVSVSHTSKQQLIAGSLRRHDKRDENYVFELRANGNLLSSQWNGDLFIHIQKAELGPSLALAGWQNHGVDAGQLTAKIWSRWEAASLQRAAVDIDILGLARNGATPSLINAINASGVAIRHRDGWSLDLDHLRIQAGDEPVSESTASVRWRKVNERPSLVAFRAEKLDLADAIHLARGSIDESLVIHLADLDPRASIDNMVGAIVHEPGRISRYFLDASVDDLSLRESQRTPGIDGLDFKIRVNNNGGLIDPTRTNNVLVQSERWLVKPVEIQKILGKIAWEKLPTGFDISTEELQIHAESIEFTTRGKVRLHDEKSPHVDLITWINAGELPRFQSLIPKDLLRPRGDKWLRTAFLAGQFKPSGLVVRGSLDQFPFDNYTGSLKGNIEVTNVDLKYSAKYPMTSAIEATIEVDGRKAITSLHTGRVYRAAVDGATVEMPDLFSRKPMVRMRGDMRVTPEDVGRFITESPLQATKASRYADVDIAGEFGMTLDINLGLYPGSKKEILGLAHFSNNRIRSKAQGITLEKLAGDISFTRLDWYGEGLTAEFNGDPVGVIFNGGLDDPNYDTEFRMTGTSDASRVFEYLKRYAPATHQWLIHGAGEDAITGRLPWKAVLTIPSGTGKSASAPKRLVIESSLVGLDVALPSPLGKTSAEKKPLSIKTETSSAGQRLTRIDFGAVVDIEIDSTRLADGTMDTSRVEALLGDTAPVFAKTPGLTVRGRTTRLPLNEWIGFARGVAAGSTKHDNLQQPISFNVTIEDLEALDRTFHTINLAGEKLEDSWELNASGPQAEGNIRIPRDRPSQSLVLDFERLWLDKVDPENKSARVDPRTLPSVTFKAKSLHFGEVDLGAVELQTTKVENGIQLNHLQATQSKFILQGNGDWLLQGDVHQSRVNLTVYDKTLSGLLERFNYDVANIDGGKTKIGIEAIWSGMPSEFTLDKLYGSFEIHVEKGRILDIEPGSGRLFGLLSLQTLPRRLSLDFNDLFRKGFTFDSIDGVFELDHGNAYTNSLLMTGPSARIDISGRTGLAEQDYDQRVTVTPALSNTIPVASALFGPAGIGVGAVIFLGQKMFKSIPEQVDKFLSREYSITGGWKQPVIERI